MKVICEERPFKPISCVAAIGVFDGLHRGHQRIISCVRARARARHVRSLLITFDRPPQVILKKPFLGCLFDRQQKIERARQLGIDVIWFLRAQPSFFKLSGKQFIQYLLARCDIRCLVSGADFRFGFQAAHSIECLTGFAKEHGFDFCAIRKRVSGGHTISSSLIRQCLKAGDLARARRYMGCDYSVHGVVCSGRGIGATLGFPTANIDTKEYLIPASGVYAAQARIGTHVYPAAVNIGTNPTLGSTARAGVEAHIIGLSRNIVGRDVALRFVKRMRDEKKFFSRQELSQAIARDVAAVAKMGRSARQERCKETI